MNVLALGAHPDDIEFGCGGTLLKYSREGHIVCIMVMSLGDKGGHAQVRQKEQMTAAEIIGTKEVYWGTYRDTEVPNNRECISTIESIIKEVAADLIFVNYPDDTHQDHRNLAQSVITASRYIKSVLFYETMTTVGFTPTVFMDIESVFEEKLNLLKAHESQVMKTNIEGLSALDIARSVSHFQGIKGRMKNAEGFMPLRFNL